MLIESITFWHWLVLALVLASAEIILPGSILLWLGLAAAQVGLIAWLFPHLSWEQHFMLFSILSVITLVIGRKFFAVSQPQSDHPLLNQKTAQFIGQTYILDSPIINGRGKIRINDSLWKIVGPDCPKDTEVLVYDVENAVLKVSLHHPEQDEKSI